MSGRSLRYRLAQGLCTTLPASVAFALAERLADWQWQHSAIDRAAVQANLSLVLGTDVAEESPLVREVFRNFGRYLVEFLAMHRVGHPMVRVEGEEHLIDARRAQRGVIAHTAHVGNWELGGVLIRRMGIPVAAVALPHADPATDRLFNAQRERCGITVIPLNRHATQRSLQRLREGYVLGMPGDRDFTGNGLRVSCCAHQLTAPRGPALLSLRSGAPVVPTFLTREGRWQFRLCFDPPIWPTSRAPLARSVVALTQAYTNVMEHHLTHAPSQWLLFQPVTTETQRNQRTTGDTTEPQRVR